MEHRGLVVPSIVQWTLPPFSSWMFRIRVLVTILFILLLIRTSIRTPRLTICCRRIRIVVLSTTIIHRWAHRAWHRDLTKHNCITASLGHAVALATFALRITIWKLSLLLILGFFSFDNTEQANIVHIWKLILLNAIYYVLIRCSDHKWGRKERFISTDIWWKHKSYIIITYI